MRVEPGGYLKSTKRFKPHVFAGLGALKACRRTTNKIQASLDKTFGEIKKNEPHKKSRAV